MGRAAPEIEQLFVLQVRHGAPVGALDVIGHDLQVGLHVDGGAGHQQQVAAQLLGVRPLRGALHLYVAVENSPPCTLNVLIITTSASPCQLRTFLARLTTQPDSTWLQMQQVSLSVHFHGRGPERAHSATDSTAPHAQVSEQPGLTKPFCKQL